MKHNKWPFEELPVPDCTRELTKEDEDMIFRNLKKLYPNTKTTNVRDLIEEQFNLRRDLYRKDSK